MAYVIINRFNGVRTVYGIFNTQLAAEKYIDAAALLGVSSVFPINKVTEVK